jgi:glycosyltransferase involved in cell wall biosynthesis
MKKKIAITFPWLNLYGGGEVFCEYCSNLLSNYYLVDLIVYDNHKKKHHKLRFKKSINIIYIKSNNPIINFFCSKFMIFSQVYIIYYFNYINKIQYNFVYSSGGEFFSKFRTYQYIHMCIFSNNFFEYKNFGLNNNFKKLIRLLFVVTSRFILRINKNTFKEVFTMTNSNWSLERIKKNYEIKKKIVIYPTFKIPKFYKVTYEQFNSRSNDFVLLGRVSADKKIIDGINIFIKINKVIPESKLHIIGPIDIKYKNSFDTDIFKNKNIIFHGLLSLKDRDKILRKSKFGLNFFYSEHFGRNVLEMQKMGMIVFARNEGGVREILFSKYQKYLNYNDLIGKFYKVFFSPKLQKKILTQNHKYLMNNFSDKDFKHKFLSIFGKNK